ncbi:MAG: VWA domain-containing protein [Halioglobus sp.]|nr:VWA domain-containing protein [Halioglobus sp.]
MARRKREFNTFNLSFLDIMSCGFGAVVLVFLIMNHAIENEQLELNEDLLSEVSLVEEDITEGRAGLVRLRNTLSDLDLEVVDADGRANRITEEIDEYEALLSQLIEDGFTDPEEIDTLRAELAALQDEVEELRAANEESTGLNARSFLGDGNRQYLTGLNLGGKHIAILLDTSSSMLSDQLVQIIRLRNMDSGVQRAADKWVRSLDTVDWLTAQLPINAKYQVLLFNTDTRAVLPDTEGKWLEVANEAQLVQLTDALREQTPSGGTSLENAFLALNQLTPRPDNIFLITDGLPTQGATPSGKSRVSGGERQKLFRQAVATLPERIPVNVILAPMEGDPMAAAEFWKLATRTRGAFLSPSRDWP